MTRRQSPPVSRAIELVERGMTAYRAAKTTGIALSTMYRALHRPGNADARARCAECGRLKG